MLVFSRTVEAIKKVHPDALKKLWFYVFSFGLPNMFVGVRLCGIHILSLFSNCCLRFFFFLYFVYVSMCFYVCLIYFLVLSMNFQSPMPMQLFFTFNNITWT